MGPGHQGAVARDGRPARSRGFNAVRWKRLATSAAWTGLPFLVLLVVWQTITVLGVFPKLWVPGPEDVVAAGLKEWHSGVLVSDIQISAARLAGGFTIGAGLGMLLGGVMGTSRRVSA